MGKGGVVEKLKKEGKGHIDSLHKKAKEHAPHAVDSILHHVGSFVESKISGAIDKGKEKVSGYLHKKTAEGKKFVEKKIDEKVKNKHVKKFLKDNIGGAEKAIHSGIDKGGERAAELGKTLAKKQINKGKASVAKKVKRGK